MNDEAFMRRALEVAARATDHGDVPIGAVLVDRDGVVLAEAHNRREVDCDPAGHAEILALREAARARGSWRLAGTTLYVTLEPCPMCAGALVNARVDRVVWGCSDEKAGAMGSLFVIGLDPRLNHRLVVRGQVLAKECAELLRGFFAGRRETGRRGGRGAGGVRG
jgi:tRNA(adenine34) deaminase